jgi:hypothetical protein
VIELSRNEQGAVYAALVPAFRPERRRYSTAYRGGDSPDGLAIDLERGWFDHVTGENGDCIAFAQLATRCDFRTAVRWISDIIGRDLSSGQPKRPKYSDKILARADLFRIGFRWAIERYLDALKELWAIDESAVDVQPIRDATRLLDVVTRWSPWQTARFLENFRRRGFVEQCIREAREAQTELAHAITGTFALKGSAAT